MNELSRPEGQIMNAEQGKALFEQLSSASELPIRAIGLTAMNRTSNDPQMQSLNVRLFVDVDKLPSAENSPYAGMTAFGISKELIQINQAGDDFCNTLKQRTGLRTSMSACYSKPELVVHAQRSGRVGDVITSADRPTEILLLPDGTTKICAPVRPAIGGDTGQQIALPAGDTAQSGYGHMNHCLWVKSQTPPLQEKLLRLCDAIIAATPEHTQAVLDNQQQNPARRINATNNERLR